MSAGMPELGSKISLISKADIRYEGRLFTVDPQECTIALANVRSFGTEERETQFPVAPQNQVYEYILFRGSDIKDIRVVTNVNNMPNDPAIVQMTVPQGQPAYQPQPGFAHPMMGQMGPLGGQYGNPYGMAMGAMGPVMGMPGGGRDPRGPMNKPPSELSSGLAEPNVITIPNTLPTANVKPLTKDQSLEDGVLDLISGGSRSTTPTSSLMTRKSPTMDQGIQVGHQQQQSQSQHQQHPQHPPHPQHQQSNNLMAKFGDQSGNRTVQPPRRGREGSPGSGRTGRGMGQYSERKHEAMKQDGQMHEQGHPQGLHGPAGRGQRGGWIARGGNMRGRGRGRGAFRTNQPGNTGAKPKNTLKFDNDYDFEQANTEFEELRSRLAKAKIDAGTENEKKDDSGNETGAGEGEPEEDPDVVHYDKSKSFFDNISCEAVERSKGRSQRTDWRTERKLNSETFGVASTRRGGFRGRGYYNRGMGGMYRGGGGGSGGQMGGGPQGGLGGGGGGYRGNYRGQRGGNRKPQGPNQAHLQNPGQTRVEQPTNQQQQQQSQQQSASSRLVTGTA